jgi:hypothetical protein
MFVSQGYESFTICWLVLVAFEHRFYEAGRTASVVAICVAIIALVGKDKSVSASLLTYSVLIIVIVACLTFAFLVGWIPYKMQFE